MKNLQIGEEHDQLLEKLKERLDRPKKKIVEQLIHYAYKLKIDPEFLKEGDPSHEIRKTRNDLIAFIRTQEKDHLKPLYDQVRLLVEHHYETSDSLLKKTDYESMESRMVKNQQMLLHYFTENRKEAGQEIKQLSQQFEQFKRQMADLEIYRRKVRDTVQAYFQALQDNRGLTGVKDREKIEEAFKREIYSL